MAGKKVLKVRTKRNNNSTNNSSTTGITISELNDDCLKCILARLPFKDKLKLQRVSKRWQTLMPWDGTNKLSIGSDTFLYGEEVRMPYSLPIMKKVLHLCGNFIKDIEIELSKPKSTATALLKLLKESCPNLKSLNLHGLELTKPVIEFLVQNFTTLNSFGFGRITRGCEKQLTGFFLKAKNITDIKIMNSNVTGKCLKALPLMTTEKFDIMGAENLMIEDICKIFQRMSSLRILAVADDDLKLIENIDKLLEMLPNITNVEYLTLHVIEFPLDPPDRERVVQMKNVCCLTNLQKLFLHGPQVFNDESLTIIGNTCTRLKKATILDSHRLTDVGWKNFAKLSSIEDLKIGQLWNISEKCLDYLQATALKIFMCYKMRLNNRSLKVLLNSAKNLTSLDVALCPKVNRTTLVKEASAQIESRPKHETLKLLIEIDNSIARIKNISSRLVIKKTNCHFVELERMQSQMTPGKAWSIFLNLVSEED